MADTEQDPGPGEKEANKPPSPKPDQEGEVAPPLVSVAKTGKLFSEIFTLLLTPGPYFNRYLKQKKKKKKKM